MPLEDLAVALDEFELITEDGFTCEVLKNGSTLVVDEP